MRLSTSSNRRLSRAAAALAPRHDDDAEAASAAAVAQSAAAAAVGHSPPSSAAEPTVFVYDDGRHASPLYQFAPPLSADDIVFTVDQAAGSGADTLIVSAGLEGGPVHFDSQCAPLWGANVDTWEHVIFYRASRNLHQLIAGGHDPMALMCGRANAAGLFFLPTLPLCIVGQSDPSVGRGMGRTSDFAYESRLHVGPEVDPTGGPQPAELTRMYSQHRLDFLLQVLKSGIGLTYDIVFISDLAGGNDFDRCGVRAWSFILHRRCETSALRSLPSCSLAMTRTEWKWI